MADEIISKIKIQSTDYELNAATLNNKSDEVFVQTSSDQTIDGVKTFLDRPLSKETYTQLEYIESPATSASVFPYIRTGVTRGVTYTTGQSLSCILDGYFTASQTLGFNGYDSGGQLGQSSGKWSTESGTSTVSALTRATILQVLNFPSSYDRLYQLNGTTYSQIANRAMSSVGNYAQAADYPLFVAYNGTYAYKPAKLRMYSFKIYIGDYYTSPSTCTLIRNFIPAKNAQNEVGLLDLVNNKFYKNLGNEDFTAGPTVTTIEVSTQLLTSGDVSKVALTNNYNDLDNKPTIPTVSNATITVSQTDLADQTFTLNGSAKTISLNDTKYTFASGSTAGAFSVTPNLPSGSTAQTVNIYGWGNKQETKPNGTDLLIDSNTGKVNTKYIPDFVLGQLLFGGTVNASTAVATLSDNAKIKLGTSSITITLTNDTTAITGYKANEGIYYIVTTAGTFASTSFAVGDWLISNGSAWKKVDNTDEVTSVTIGASGVLTSSNSSAQTGPVSASITHNQVLGSAYTTSSVYKTKMDAYGHISEATAIDVLPVYTVQQSDIASISDTVYTFTSSFRNKVVNQDYIIKIPTGFIANDVDFLLYPSSLNILDDSGTSTYYYGYVSMNMWLSARFVFVDRNNTLTLDMANVGYAGILPQYTASSNELGLGDTDTGYNTYIYGKYLNGNAIWESTYPSDDLSQYLINRSNSFPSTPDISYPDLLEYNGELYYKKDSGSSTYEYISIQPPQIKRYI